MNVIEGTGSIVVEPDWSLLLTDEIEIAAAHEHWRVVTTELRERQLLSPTNGHAIQRLVAAYVLYDRCYRIVAEQGAVAKPKRGNTKAIARISPHFTAMREAGSDAAVLDLRQLRRGRHHLLERHGRPDHAAGHGHQRRCHQLAQ